MIVHVRIDDRLLHGQVIHGWLPTLSPRTMIVADDRAAGDEWERETYEAGATEDVGVDVLGLEPAARALAEPLEASGPLFVLVRGPIELLRLVRSGYAPREVVVGGLHAAEGRVRFRDDLQISPAEAAAFVALTNAGIRCYYQPLPTDAPAELPDMTTLLDRGSKP